MLFSLGLRIHYKNVSLRKGKTTLDFHLTGIGVGNSLIELLVDHLDAAC